MKSFSVTPGRYENIREGWAHAMILLGKHAEFDIGEQFDFRVNVNGENYMPIEVLVVKILIVAGEDLDTDDFEAAFTEHGWEGVRKLYPNASKEDVFTIVYFDLL